MKDTLIDIKTESAAVIVHLVDEVSALRAGRATPALVEHVKVEAYGEQTSIEQVASISSPDAKTLLIQPWDKSIMAALQAALSKANLGMQPVVQENRILLSMPTLTTERREEILRILSSKVEQAHVSLRQKRDKARSDVMSAFKNKEISEDDKFRYQKEIDEEIEKLIGEIKKIDERKRKELEG
jgi:ribosome recycling factor